MVIAQRLKETIVHRDIAKLALRKKIVVNPTRSATMASTLSDILELELGFIFLS